MSGNFEIVDIFIAPEHSYWYLKGQREAAVRPMTSVHEVECIAGQGLRGDRYFGFKENFKGQVTFHAMEVFEALCGHLGVENCPPWLTRRNVMTRGLDLDALIGRRFRIGEVEFEGVEECAPCEWMDRAIGAGAREFLRDRGGLRARITRSGLLRAGPAAWSAVLGDEVPPAEAPAEP